MRAYPESDQIYGTEVIGAGTPFEREKKTFRYGEPYWGIWVDLGVSGGEIPAFVKEYGSKYFRGLDAGMAEIEALLMRFPPSLVAEPREQPAPESSGRRTLGQLLWSLLFE